MCIACVLWEKGKLTAKEADGGLAELVNDASSDEELMHYQEAIERIQAEEKGK